MLVLTGVHQGSALGKVISSSLACMCVFLRVFMRRRETKRDVEEDGAERSSPNSFWALQGISLTKKYYMGENLQQASSHLTEKTRLLRGTRLAL
jgi:hypothetical protein